MKIERPFMLLSEIPDTGQIVISVSSVTRAQVEQALGSPRWHADPPEVPSPSDFWAIQVDDHALLLEHTPDLLGVYSRTRDPEFLCRLLGLDRANVASYNEWPAKAGG